MKKAIALCILVLSVVFLMMSCDAISDFFKPEGESESGPCTVKWAGVRVSYYGIKSSFREGKEFTFPSESDMVGFGRKMSACYEGSTGAYILIVGTAGDIKDDNGNVVKGTCSLMFPLSKEINYAYGSKEDFYESYLTALDAAGYSVWLQVEAGDADLVSVATEVMNRYKKHSCVKGFGIDVEWYQHRRKSTDPEGEYDSTKLSDSVAKAVVDAVRKINPEYTVFVKHWDEDWLPPKYRDGLIFVNDSQYYDSAEDQSDDFAAWAAHFAPNPVMFQIGYPEDKSKVWGKYANPAKELGKCIVDGCKSGNDVGIIWVDFTLKEAMSKIDK